MSHPVNLRSKWYSIRLISVCAETYRVRDVTTSIPKIRPALRLNPSDRPMRPSPNKPNIVTVSHFVCIVLPAPPHALLLHLFTSRHVYEPPKYYMDAFGVFLRSKGVRFFIFLQILTICKGIIFTFPPK
jgi:hypothetical protein